MILINRRFDLALRVAQVLYERTYVKSGVIIGQELAKRCDCSISYIEQTVRLLREHRIVDASRGPSGGYSLAPGIVLKPITLLLDAINAEGREMSYLDRLILDKLDTISVMDFMENHANA